MTSQRTQSIAMFVGFIAGALSLGAVIFEYLTKGVIADMPLIGGLWLLLMALGIRTRKDRLPPR